MDTKTAYVTMDHFGAVLTLGDISLEDWRNLTNEEEEDSDCARAVQMYNDLVALKVEFVVDLENNGNKNPMPVEEYKANIVKFISEIGGDISALISK